jgi:hypothetical protein
MTTYASFRPLRFALDSSLRRVFSSSHHSSHLTACCVEGVRFILAKCERGADLPDCSRLLCAFTDEGILAEIACLPLGESFHHLITVPLSTEYVPRLCASNVIEPSVNLVERDSLSALNSHGMRKPSINVTPK